MLLFFFYSCCNLIQDFAMPTFQSSLMHSGRDRLYQQHLHRSKQDSPSAMKFRKPCKSILAPCLSSRLAGAYHIHSQFSKCFYFDRYVILIRDHHRLDHASQREHYCTIYMQTVNYLRTHTLNISIPFPCSYDRRGFT